MKTLERIRAEITELFKASGASNSSLCFAVVQIIDKYAEQEPCDDCDYSEIVDWEQDAKTGKAKPIYWCEKHKEPCDDAVSRQAVLDGIEELKQSPWATDKRGNGFEYLITEALDIVADLCVKQEPSVRPQEPKTGYWIEKDGFDGDTYYDCSECGESFCLIDGTPTDNMYNYCPNCGAKMVEPRESEDKE